MIAGLHYVKDNEAGKELGIALANYFKQRAKVSPALGWLWGEALKEWENV